MESVRKPIRFTERGEHARAAADRLLPGAIADVDGIAERRKGTVSVFDGPMPEVVTFDDPGMEAEMVGDWLTSSATIDNPFGMRLSPMSQVRSITQSPGRTDGELVLSDHSSSLTPGGGRSVPNVRFNRNVNDDIP